MLDTRKTVPGLRLLDKWAVLIGGGKNHRIGEGDRAVPARPGMWRSEQGCRLCGHSAEPLISLPCHLAGLYDMVMIKDNHIAAAGGIPAAVAATEVCMACERTGAINSKLHVRRKRSAQVGQRARGRTLCS